MHTRAQTPRAHTYTHTHTRKYVGVYSLFFVEVQDHHPFHPHYYKHHAGKYVMKVLRWTAASAIEMGLILLLLVVIGHDKACIAHEAQLPLSVDIHVQPHYGTEVV